MWKQAQTNVENRAGMWKESLENMSGCGNVEFATLLFGRKNDKIWHMILEEKIYAAKKRRKAFAGREL